MSRILAAVSLGLICWLPPGLFSTPANAQPEVTLRVIVTSVADGTPVPGATVVLAVPEGDTLQAGATSPDGYLEFSDITPGTYELGVSYVGYETHREELQLEEGRRIHRVALSDVAEVLDEIVVEVERGIARRQAGLQTVDAADLDRIPTPAPGGDLAAYLQMMPGVVTAGDRGGELYIRGGTPSQNMFLIDNIPIVKPFHISNLFSAFPEETLQSVDIYAGGFGARYVGATSSVIDVRLRQGSMRSHRGSAAFSPYLVSAHVEGPVVVDQQSFLGLFRHSLIEQFADPLTGEAQSMRFYDVTGRYSLQTRNLTCNLTGVHTHDDGQINPLREVVLSWTNTVIGGRCFGFDEDLEQPYDVTLGYTRYQTSEGTTDRTERDASHARVFVYFDHRTDLEGVPVDYGVGWSLHTYAAELDERFVMYDTFEAMPFVLQGYVSTDWLLFDRVTVEPSLGSQISSYRLDRPTLEPRLRMAYQPGDTDRQELSLALGMYYQIAEAITDERDAGTVFSVWKALAEGEPMMRALHAVAGYRQQLGQYVEASVEAYIKEHANIPVSRWTPEARLDVETTRANGFTTGVDARVVLDYAPFYLYLGYALADVRYEATSEDLGAWIGDPVFSYSPPHDRRHQLSTILSYELAGFSANASWDFGSGTPYTQVFGYDLALWLPDQHPMTDAGTAMTLFYEPYGARLPTYHRLDVSLERDFEVADGVVLDAEAGVINLYDRRNVFYFDVNTLQRVDQMPLMPYVSLSASFN